MEGCLGAQGGPVQKSFSPPTAKDPTVPCPSFQPCDFIRVYSYVLRLNAVQYNPIFS